MKEYVEERDGNYYVAGTRIGLDSIVYSFKEGSSAEALLQSFPGMASLENVYGAITFYLANKESVEAYLREGERIWAEHVAKQAASSDPLLEKLRLARQAFHEKLAS